MSYPTINKDYYYYYYYYYFSCYYSQNGTWIINWYLFSNFLVMATISNRVFLFRKLSVDFQNFQISVFCHRAYSKTRNPWKIFVRSFSSTSLGILCMQCTSLIVLLKVINEYSLLNLESGFSCFKAKMVLG